MVNAAVTGTQPTITYSIATGSSTITSGVDHALTLPAAGSDQAGPCLVYGPLELRVDPAATPGIGGNGSLWPGMTNVMNVEFMTDAPTVELIYWDNLSNFRVKVDNQWAKDTYAAGADDFCTNANGFRRMAIAFGSRKLRRVTVMGGALAVKAITVAATDSLYAPPSKRRRVLWVGDSYAQANGFDAFCYVASERLGWDGVIVDGEGGTGYSHDGAAVKFQGRSAKHIAAKPDIIAVCGGINDSAEGPAALLTNARTLFDTYLAALPNVKIIAVGPWAPSNQNVTDKTPLGVSINTAATERGIPYIDTLTVPWMTGTGAGSATVADGATTSGSPTFTSASSSFSALHIGSKLTGAGIPANTTISGVTNSTTVTMNANATATATGVSVTINNARNDGNVDLLIKSDFTHPNLTGSDYLGWRLAHAIKAAGVTA